MITTFVEITRFLTADIFGQDDAFIFPYYVCVAKLWKTSFHCRLCHSSWGYLIQNPTWRLWNLFVKACTKFRTSLWGERHFGWVESWEVGDYLSNFEGMWVTNNCQCKYKSNKGKWLRMEIYFISTNNSKGLNIGTDARPSLQNQGKDLIYIHFKK